MALPSRYTQLGYLRATGTQYINMFYQPKLFGRIECKFKFHTTGRQMLLGSWGSASNLSYVIEKTASNNYNTDASGITKSSSVTTPLNVDQWYELDYNLNQNYISIDGNAVGTTSGTPTCTRAWYLFASNDAQSGTYLKANASIEYLKLYDTTGILVHSYVPAISEYVNVVGLFDEIEEVFWENDGTGTFQYPYTISATVSPSNSGTITGDTYYDPGTDATLTAIPNPGYNFEKWINEDYRLMDAIASTGTQYINVDTNSASNMKIVVDITPNGEGYDDNCIIGFSNNNSSTYRGEIVKRANGKYALYLSSSGSGTYKELDNASDDRITLTYTQISGRQELTDGTNSVTFNYTSINNTGFYIFSYYAGSRYYGKFRLHSCKIWMNDVLVRDYVPVLKDSGLVPGLLDLVEMKFYANSGTGEFQAYEETPDITRIVLTDNPLTIKNLTNTIDLIAQFKQSANCRYKVNGAWKNAMMYIKQNGTWKPGTPKIKINGNWKEGG